MPSTYGGANTPSHVSFQPAEESILVEAGTVEVALRPALRRLNFETLCAHGRVGRDRRGEIMLSQGEALSYKISNVALIEARVRGGHYAGGSSGVAIPIGSLGGRSMRYRVGSNALASRGRGNRPAGPSPWFSGRGAKLHLPATCTWASQLAAAFRKLRALPAAAG